MALSQKDADVQMMLAAQCHLGTKNCDFQMERYVWKRRKDDGIYILNLGKTWDKLQLAARIIVAIENPADIVVQSARPYGQRAVLKFAQYTGANCLSGRHTPGAAPCVGAPRTLLCQP
jgi:small subunit ribosomal protein SAe